MKTSLLFIAALFLSACAPRIPEIPLTDVPAAPLTSGIDLRSRAVAGLKAAGRVTTERKARRRVYESVAVLVKGPDKLRIEGFGPMGEPVFALVANGPDLALRLPGEAELVRTGPWAFERLLGFSLAASELAALLMGNAPPVAGFDAARAGCSASGQCVVEYRKDDALWKVRVVPSEPFEVLSCERYRGGDLLYRARFADHETAGGHRFPRKVTVESGDRKASLTVEYQDWELNAPVEDAFFVLPAGEAAPR